MLQARADAADGSGILPAAPYGTFSTLSTTGVGKGTSSLGLLFQKSGGPDFYSYTSVMWFGITDDIDVGMVLPYVDDRVAGVEDISIALKHTISQGGGTVPSVAYAVLAGLETGTEEYGTDGYLGAGVIIGKRMGPVNASANLMYTAPGDDALDDQLRASAGIDFSASHNFNILGEIYAVNGFRGREADRLEARFGYRFKYTRHAYTVMGVGLGMNDKVPDYRLMISVTLHFPAMQQATEGR